MTDPFASPRRILARAQYHIRDLHQRINTFLGDKPYGGVIEFDSARSKYLHKLKLTQPLPDEFAAITADATANLRTTLDQCGYVAAFAYKGKRLSKGTYFPFGETLAELNNNIRDACKNIPDDIIAVFRFFQPYKGGNNYLWALNRICNTNKHKLIVPVGIIYGDARVVFKTDSGTVSLSSPRWDTSKHEIIYAVTDSEKLAPYKLQFGLEVTFNEIDVVAGKPVVPVLNDFAGIVESILLATEAEARRIGLVS